MISTDQLEYYASIYAISYDQILELSKILNQEKHLLKALHDLDIIGYDNVYNKATEGYYSQRTLKDIEYILRTLLQLTPCSKEELDDIEPIFYTAYETGVLSLKLYGEELETLIKIFKLFQHLTQVEKDELTL